MDDSGPLGDIVISCRIRLARNIAGFQFFSHADAEQQAEVLGFVRDKVMASELKNDLWYIDMSEISALEREMLTERHVISKQLAQSQGARAVALSHDESLAMMINEEDHLRLQVLASGLQLRENYDRINRVDTMLEDSLKFAFSPDYGYLTACPTNVGTGIRVSVMLHLPALKLLGQIDKVFRAAKDMHLAIRGLYGEGTEPAGDLYQLSNQITLGKTEEQIIDEFIRRTVEPVVEYERLARKKLLKDRFTVLSDKIYRAVGLLSHAWMISSEEAMHLLSFVRLGINLELIKNIHLRDINDIFLLTQPAHLQALSGKSLDAGGRDEARAQFIRDRLSGN